MLKTKQVGKYTVSQAGPREEARMIAYSKRVESIEVEDEADREALTQWAYVAAVTRPIIPLEDYLNTPAVELREILEAVAETNGDVLEADAERSKKKTAEIALKSTDTSSI